MSFWIRRKDVTGKHHWLIDVNPVTVLILAALATFLAPRLGELQFRSQQQIAQIQIMELKGALEMFRWDVGRYPSTQEGLLALARNTGTVEGWKGPYTRAKGIPDDPWGRPYVYRYPGRDRPFDLMSYGRDGKKGGTGLDKDITY